MIFLFALNDLITPVTKDQVKASIYDVLGIVGVSTTGWFSGAPLKTMITAVAIVVAAFSQLTAAIARSGFLELADGDWLTLVARYVYWVERIDATFASGEVTLTNTGGGVYDVDPEDLVVSSPTTGKTFRNTELFSLGAGATLTIPIVAIEAGAASTAPPNTITELETTLNGVTVTNALAVVGSDKESDPNLRTRCSEKLGALSPNGPPDAYAFVARSAKRADGTEIGVTRVRVIKDGFGNVFVYVGTPTGGVTGDKDDPNTDLGAIHDKMQKLAAPLSVTEETFTAVKVEVPVSYSVWMYNTSGLTEAELVKAIADRLTSFMSTQPIGGNVIGVNPGKVFLDAIKTAIGATRPEIFHVELAVPSADVELTSEQVPVPGTITAIAINQIAPGTPQ